MQPKKHKLLVGKIFHKRLSPKTNKFNYSIYYLALSLKETKNLANNLIFSRNKFALFSFYDKDHGDRKNNDCSKWHQDILKENQLEDICQNITLITMPRIFGYVFNPVSFWLCLDKNDNLRAVISEVNNTFGETHSYLSHNSDKSEITINNCLETKKLFHVSPFFKREGYYKFRFNFNNIKNILNIEIDYYNSKNEKLLITSLKGKLIDFNNKNLLILFLKHPLINLKTIFMIHFQALKLVSKSIKYQKKPQQLKKRFSKN